MPSFPTLRNARHHAQNSLRQHVSVEAEIPLTQTPLFAQVPALFLPGSQQLVWVHQTVVTTLNRTILSMTLTDPALVEMAILVILTRRMVNVFKVIAVRMDTASHKELLDVLRRARPVPQGVAAMVLSAMHQIPVRRRQADARLTMTALEA